MRSTPFGKKGRVLVLTAPKHWHCFNISFFFSKSSVYDCDAMDETNAIAKEALCGKMHTENELNSLKGTLRSIEESNAPQCHY